MNYSGKKCGRCHLHMNRTQFAKSQLKKTIKNRKCLFCSRTAEKDPQDLLNELCTWLLANDATLKNVNIIQYTDEYRGVTAGRMLKRGDYLARIPLKCIMSTTSSRQTKNGKILHEKGYNDHNLLAIHLLDEKYDPCSLFSPYISILPTKFETVPLFFDEEKIKQLDKCFVVDMIRAKINLLEQEYEGIKSILDIPYTFHEFVWARTVVITRVFGYKRDNKQESGLVPVADMINHSGDPSTNWKFSDENNTFDVSANRWILKGCDVFDSYGPKCNSRYMVNYGFTLPSNQKNNQCVLFIPTDNFSDKKKKLMLSETTRYDDGYACYISLVNQKLETKVSSGKFTRMQFPIIRKNVDKCTNCAYQLLRFCRIAVASEKDLESKITLCPISKQNEIDALVYLGTLVSDRLNEFETTIEEDLDAISRAQQYTDSYNIINTRISEKGTLDYYKRLADLVSNEPGGNISKRLRNHPEFTDYYTEVWKKIPC